MPTVLFGDSIGKGITNHHQKLTLTAISPIDFLYQTYRIPIINMTSIGQTLKRLHEKKIIQRYLDTMDGTQNHYVAFAIGGNDADYDWASVAETPDFPHPSKTPLDLFESLLTQYVKAFKSKGAEVVLMTTVPLISVRYFNQVIAKVANPTQILRFFNGDVEMISRHQESYSHVIAKIAYQQDCILIDFRTPLLQHPKFNDLISIDGVHPIQAGYDFIHEILQKAIVCEKRLINWFNEESHSMVKNVLNLSSPDQQLDKARHLKHVD